MVITVTLNPAMDKTVVIDNMKIGEVNFVSGERYDVAGKGINVTKTLKNFQVNSFCTGFMGGLWNKNFEQTFERLAIDNVFIRVRGNVRTNLKIIERSTGLVTEFNEVGPPVNKEKLEEFYYFFNNICGRGDLVILSGGIPPEVPIKIYRDLIKICKEREAYVIVDTRGKNLQEAIKESPNVIKPNFKEFKYITGLKQDCSIEEIAEAGIKIKNRGIEEVVVSIGDEGAIFVLPEGAFYAKVPKVEVNSTVGSGDAMVAALVYSKVKNLDVMDKIKFVTATGVASTLTEGTQACNLKDVKEFIPLIEVNKF